MSCECKYAQNVVSQSGCGACLDPLLVDRISHTALTQRIDISNSRAVIRLVKHPYMTFSFRVVHVHVSTYNVVYGKETVMRVWRHELPILACMLLKKVEDWLDVQITCIHLKVFVLYVCEKKEKEEKQN